LAPGPTAADGVPPGDAGHETGYDNLTGVTEVVCPAALALDDDGRVTLHLVGRAGETVLAATAPGPPGADFGEGAPLRFLIRRARGAGRWIHLVTWTPDPVEVREGDGLIEVRRDGHAVVVQETPAGLTLRPAGAPTVRFDARPMPPASAGGPPAQGVPPCEIPLWPAEVEPFGIGLRVAEWELGEASYRRSERSHAERGAVHAALAVGGQGGALLIRVRVRKSEIVIRPPDAADPALDNEPADIHSDGVQAYVGRDQWMGVLALPALDDGTIRVRPVGGTAAFPGVVTGSCRRTADGYELRLRLPTGRPWRSGERFRFTVTVNEMVPGRERRSGQLALAGGGWVWLRGDRESPLGAVEAEIA